MLLAANAVGVPAWRSKPSRSLAACIRNSLGLLVALIFLAIDLVLVGYVSFFWVTTAAASLHRFPSYWWATTLIVVIALGYPTSVVLLARAAARGWSGRLDVGRLIAVSLWCLIPAVLGVALSAALFLLWAIVGHTVW